MGRGDSLPRTRPRDQNDRLHADFVAAPSTIPIPNPLVKTPFNATSNSRFAQPCEGLESDPRNLPLSRQTKRRSGGNNRHSLLSLLFAECSPKLV